MSTNNWAELSPEKKLAVLDWAKEGLIKQTALAVGHAVQHAMVRDIQNKALFDPTEFYDRIHPRSRAHWEHTDKYAEMIDEEIRKIKCEMAAEYSPKTVTDEQLDAGTYKEVLIPPTKTTPEYPLPNGGCGNGGK